jgi:DNA adenine methylase
MRSPLRWAGSKRSLLPRLRSYWPGGATRYIEPFCGSSCFFFDIQPSQAILGDLNEELIFALRAIKKAPQLVLESLRRLRMTRRNYYRIRALSPLSLAEAERAARFLYLNRNCFNGIYRTNAKGEFNVPYGPPRSGRPMEDTALLGAAQALTSASIIHADFERTLTRARSGDFVYLDPPYFLDSRRVFREYVPGSFGAQDLERLAAQLCRLEALGAKFVISYADSPEARDLLRRWKPRRVRVRRNIAGFSHHRRNAYELIAANFRPPHEVHVCRPGS